MGEVRLAGIGSLDGVAQRAARSAASGPERRLRALAVIAAYLAAYLLLDWLSFIHALHGIGITPWNPSPGVSLALLLLAGLAYAPALVVAPLLSTLLLPPAPVPLAAALVAALAIAAGYTVAAAFLRLGLGFDPRLERSRDVVALIAVGLGAAFFVALGYVATFAAAGVIPREDVVVAAFQYWIGDAIGIAVMAPPLLLFLGARRPAWPPRLPAGVSLAEIAAQAVATSAALVLVFWVEGGREQFKLFYLLFLPLIWIAARHGLAGAAWAVLGIQAGLIAALEFHDQSVEIVRSFQLLMFALAATGLLLGAAVSERRRAERALRQHEAELAHVSRLSVAGEMASALAHELNQPLTAIVAYAQACRRLLATSRDTPPAVAEAFDKVVLQADRAGTIIRRLRDFLREGVSHRSTIAVDELLGEAMTLVEPEATQSGIALQRSIAAGLPPVLVDRIQIEQVVVNLVRNAIEALRDGAAGPREITVGAGRGADGFVAIEVADTGPGLPENIAERLFDPFVTTKPRGMGLGLSISRSIVEAHGGTMSAAPRPGGGSVFRFTVPTSEPAGERPGAGADG